MDAPSPIPDLVRMGMDPVRIAATDLLHEKHGNRLYRVRYDGQPYVLKWFDPSSPLVEVASYDLLGDLGVPTIPLHRRTGNALLLEDLEASPRWRLATEADATSRDTGRAVAEWYRKLHDADRRLLSRPGVAPCFLTREADALYPEAIVEIGRRLGLPDHPVWAFAAGQIEGLKSAMRALPETLNYNDFHWTNLALSREGSSGLRAIVFDYHLLGIGPRFSDFRNVVGSLGEEAAATFREAYGPVDEKERAVDEPMAILYALSVAVKRPRWPTWAQECLEKAIGGELERALRRAGEML